MSNPDRRGYLLDTHVLIWWWDEQERLSKTVQALIAERQEELFVSAVSALEIAIKVRLGKLPKMVLPIAEYMHSIPAEGFTHLPVSPEHARTGGLLPGDHRDPFDRVLAAQSRIEQLTLVTSDPAFRTFGCEVVW